MIGIGKRAAAGRLPGICALVVLSVSAAATGVAGAAQAPVALAKYCGKAHVTEVVDFTHFRHGKVKVGCARDPHTGLAALRQAGFRYTFVSGEPGFVCTIDHRPNPCNGAPATAYWSYWHAKPHGKWRYSTLGAGSYHPRRGWVEGWAFGRGRPPHISPP
jgi:hypothetical protein